MTLIYKHVHGVLEITPWAGCLRLGLVNPGLMRNLSSDTKAQKANSIQFFHLQFDN